MLLNMVECIDALIVVRMDIWLNFIYDQVNRTNNLVWVHGTNPLGPKKMWVPKSSPKLFDVGTHQGSKT